MKRSLYSLCLRTIARLIDQFQLQSPNIMHKETPDSGTVSSVVYLAGKVSIDSSIIQVPYEATGTVGN